MRFDLYRDGSQWRWRLLASNGRNVANGGEAYQRLPSMLRTLRAIFKGSPARLAALDRAEAKLKAAAKKLALNI